MSTSTLARRQLKAAAAVRRSQQQHRCLATPANNNPFDFTLNSSGPIKTATHDDKQSPTSAISVVLKAGPRYEPAPGLSHALKNFVFRTTNKRSALRVIRETEVYGGVLSSSLSREHLFLTAEFLRGDEALFAELLGDVLAESKLALHEYKDEVVPQLATEAAQAVSDPTVLALDVAHQLAFRKGLGNSLFASQYVDVTYGDAVSFAKQTLGNASEMAVVASGIDSSALSNLVGEYFPSSSTSASVSTPNTGSTKYFGGEMRLPKTASHHGSGDHSDHATIVAAFEGGSASKAEYTVLKHLLGGEPSIKWTKGASLLSTQAPGAVAFNLGYSDAGLFGFTVNAPTAQAGEIAQKAMSAFKSLASGSIKEEDVKRAVANARFALASQLESRLGKLELVAPQLLAGSSTDLLGALDKVTPDSVAKAAQAALKSKPSFVALGNVHALPYADSLL